MANQTPEVKMNLSKSLKALVERHFTKEQNQFVYKLLQKYIFEYFQIQIKDPELAARQFHVQMDNILAGQMEKKKDISEKIQCRVSCVECCKQPVTVSNDEADLLLKASALNEVNIDRARLKKQNSVGATGWYSLDKQDRSCVFLGDDGACQVYEHRPLYCRKHLSMDLPEKCDKDSPDIPEMFIAPEAEILASAAVSAAGGGLMSEILGEKLGVASLPEHSVGAIKAPIQAKSK